MLKTDQLGQVQTEVRLAQICHAYHQLMGKVNGHDCEWYFSDFEAFFESASGFIGCVRGFNYVVNERLLEKATELAEKGLKISKSTMLRDKIRSGELV
jgi:hypothetical protein